MRDRDRDRDWSSYRMGAVTPPEPFDPEIDLAGYKLLINPITDNVILTDGRVSTHHESGTVAHTPWNNVSAIRRPVYMADAGGGKPGLDLRGNSTDSASLDRSDTPITTYASATEMFAICVVQLNATTAGDAEYVYRFVSGGNTLRRNGAKMRFTWYDTTDRHLDCAETLSSGQRYIVAARYLAGKTGISINGGAWTEATHGANGLAGNRTHKIGNVSVNSGRDFILQLLAMTDTWPGNAEYASLVGKLASYYGVTV